MTFTAPTWDIKTGRPGTSSLKWRNCNAQQNIQAGLEPAWLVYPSVPWMFVVIAVLLRECAESYSLILRRDLCTSMHFPCNFSIRVPQVTLEKKVKISRMFYKMGANTTWVMSLRLWELQKYEYIDDEFATNRNMALWCYPWLWDLHNLVLASFLTSKKQLECIVVNGDQGFWI